MAIISANIVPSLDIEGIQTRDNFRRYQCDNPFIILVRTKNQKSRLVLTVQAFCEEKGLRSLSGVFGYAESKNQCWQVEKLLFIDLICIFSRWPPKTMELALYR